ncbi:MAG: hypothetical protein C0501_25145 [Isosphaera sp.]|nr:hypothetical protein [Isosphaera sp.]
MLRRLLAIYMTLVLAAGPTLCCCTTVYAADPQTPRGPASPSSERTPSCCKDYRPANSEDASGETRGVGGKSRPAPKPGKHQCPCKDRSGKQTLDQPSSSPTAQDVARLLTTTLLFVVALTADPAVDPDLDSGGGSSPPAHRLTSWRLLQAHHMLRC